MRRTALLASALIVSAACAQAATIVTVTPYLSQADIPANFYAGGAPTFLQDFETGTFTGGDIGGGITASAGGVIAPGNLTDSVDGDDGEIDGLGQDGHSWGSSGGGATGITFTFGSAVTAAALVWTDGAGSTTFKAFDALGVLLDETTVSIATPGSFTGQTDEDTFFGLTSAGGIGSIFISNSMGGIEVDHVQYGDMFVASDTPSPVPLPASAFLLLGGLAGLAALRRRRRI